MSWVSAIPIIGKLIDGTRDIVSQVVVDKDKQNAILENLERIRYEVDREIHIKELETKTIPWVDALHKMARTILNVLVIIAVVILCLYNIEITPTMALILGGGNVAYQIIKGPGAK